MKNSKFKIFAPSPHSAPIPCACEQKKELPLTDSPIHLKLYNKRDFNPAIAFFHHLKQLRS